MQRCSENSAPETGEKYDATTTLIPRLHDQAIIKQTSMIARCLLDGVNRCLPVYQLAGVPATDTRKQSV